MPWTERTYNSCFCFEPYLDISHLASFLKLLALKPPLSSLPPLSPTLCDLRRRISKRFNFMHLQTCFCWNCCGVPCCCAHQILAADDPCGCCGSDNHLVDRRNPATKQKSEIILVASISRNTLPTLKLGETISIIFFNCGICITTRCLVKVKWGKWWHLSTSHSSPGWSWEEEDGEEEQGLHFEPGQWLRLFVTTNKKRLLQMLMVSLLLVTYFYR